jgi:hypothetical protein
LVLPIPSSAAARHRWLLVSALALLACACGDPPPAAPSTPAPTDRLLVVDDLVVTFADVGPYVAFLDAVYPEWSRNVKTCRVLEEHVIPLLLAKRAFPEERAEKLELARAMQSVAGNAAELATKGELQPITRGRVGRRMVDLPTAMFLFDPSRLGSVSEPIEVPRGFVVAAGFDLQEAALVADDAVDAVQVAFLTHDATAFRTWLAAEQARIADKVTYFHPDHRRALPPWLKLKQKTP